MMNKANILTNWYNQDHISIQKMNEWKQENQQLLKNHQSKKKEKVLIPALYLLRHGESEQNIKKKMKKKDHSFRANELVSLTELGKKQAYSAGLQFSGLSLEAPEIIFVSQLNRTKETLYYFLKGAEIKKKYVILESPFLNEIDWGIEDFFYSQKKISLGSLILKLLEKFRYSQASFFRRKIGGESFADHLIRVRKFFDTFIRNYSGKTIMAVCHHKTVINILFNIWGSQWTQHSLFERAIKIPNAGLVALEKKLNGWQLKGWNIEFRKTDYFNQDQNPFNLITFDELAQLYLESKEGKNG